MLKRKSAHTKLEFVYGDENEDQLAITFTKSPDKEEISISVSGLEEDIVFPYEIMREVTETVQNWKGAVTPKHTKAPVITDHRDAIEGTLALDIQKQVEETMENFDPNVEQLTSLTQPSIKEAPLELDIDSAPDDDPTGISVEDISRLGPVPETPDEFRKQLTEISRKRITKPIIQDESKRITRS